MSLNSADYCKKHSLLTVQEDERFDIILPSMFGKNKYKIPEGNRWNWCRPIIFKLLMRAFYLRTHFNEDWKLPDIRATFEMIVKENVVNAAQFMQTPDYKNLDLYLEQKYETFQLMNWQQIKDLHGEYFDTKKRQYKTRSYNKEMMNLIIERNVRDPSSQEIVFDDIEDFKNQCATLYMNERTVKKYLKEKFKIVFVTSTKRQNKNREYIDSLIPDESGVYHVDLEHMNSSAFRMFCSRNHIRIVTQSAY